MILQLISFVCKLFLCIIVVTDKSVVRHCFVQL